MRTEPHAHRLTIAALLVLGLIAAAMTPAPSWAEPMPEARRAQVASILAPLPHAQSFSCTGRTCTQMSSCAEACHALLVCGDRRRDADNDGIPCENLCSRRC